MKYTFACTLLGFAFAFTTYSQNKKQLDFQELYEDYYTIQSETIFTHLNKSIYIQGESLWFASYIYFNKELKPYKSTTNVYVNIYNDLGKMIDQKVFKCDDGFLNGQFEIDTKFNPGVYYIKTTTNWMRNFNLDNSDLKKFVVNSDAKSNSISKRFDFDIIPEGGSLIYNANNTIGIKINSNNRNYNNSIKGVVTNSSKKILTTFNINQYGIGKFNINFIKNEEYFVAIYENDEPFYSKKIDNIKNSGFNLKLLHRLNNLNVVIETNEETLAKIDGKTYHIYVHRDGLISSIPINFKKGVKIYSFLIPKTELLQGVNILTLLDENNTPLVERMVFNELNFTNNSTVEVIETIKKNDSTIVKLKTNINKNFNNRFSVSALPESHDNFTFQDNIKSKLLLFPYLSKPDNHLNNYLEHFDNTSLNNLDLLLITQGNSRQSLNNIFNKPQIVKYNFDTGFQIKGKLNTTDYKAGNYVELVSLNNAFSAKSELNKLNEFSFEQLYLGTETKMNFFLKTKKGKSLRIKPYLNFYPKSFIDSIKVEQIKLKNNIPEKDSITSSNNFIIPENITELEEVELGSVATKKVTENEPLGSFFSDNITFSDTDDQFQLITSIIRQNGFDVYNDGINVSIKSRRVRNFSGAFSPAVYIDDVYLGGNLNVLTDLTVNAIEEIFIIKAVSIYGSAGIGGVINIYTKKGFSKKRKNMYKAFDVSFGFEESKPYESPNYTSTSSDFFSQLGVLNWIPNAKADKNGIITFMIPNYYNEKINLYVNGMSENGSIYSATKTISLQ